MDFSRKDAEEKLSDGDLVRLLLGGEQQAMAVIFERYYRLVMGVALRILRDPSAAEDVVQIVFMDFYERARLFDETKGSLRTWLLQYTYGRSFNEKKKLKSPSRSGQVGLEQLDAKPEHPRSVLNLEKQDAVRFVEQILSYLTERQRIVIEKAFFEGLDITEVASQTAQSLGSVYHAYYRGMDKLRRLVIGPKAQAASKPDLSRDATSWLRMGRKTPQPLVREVENAKTRAL